MAQDRTMATLNGPMWVSTILEVFLHVGSTDYYGHHVLHGL